jgi:hypothetical protein
VSDDPVLRAHDDKSFLLVGGLALVYVAASIFAAMLFDPEFASQQIGLPASMRAVSGTTAGRTFGAGTLAVIGIAMTYAFHLHLESVTKRTEWTPSRVPYLVLTVLGLLAQISVYFPFAPVIIGLYALDKKQNLD